MAFLGSAGGSAGGVYAEMGLSWPGNQGQRLYKACVGWGEPTANPNHVVRWVRHVGVRLWLTPTYARLHAILGTDRREGQTTQ